MTRLPHVLVVDDDRISRLTTTKQLKGAGYAAKAVESGERALSELESNGWDIILTDQRMPGIDGIELLKQARNLHPDIDIIVMTAYGTVSSAVTAMQEGAADYLLKPFGFEELELRLRRLFASRRTRAELQRLRRLLTDSGLDGIVGASPAMRAVFERIVMFAAHNAPVLITGETGTGKELVARALHNRGPRAGQPFVPIACGAIPRDLGESTLLGHERGAFTGAAGRRKGAFEQAHKGTVLLDDIDDLPLDLQVILLRVLQEGRFARVGGEREISVDARVVATSKIDLQRAVADGRFRSDLYYRLRGLEIHLPPLRERGGDLLLLAHHFLSVLASEQDRTPARLAPATIACLRQHPWPGNVRELRRVMEAGDALSRGGDILPGHLPDDLRRKADHSRLYTLHLDGAEQVDWQDLVSNIEADLIAWALDKAEGQQKRAAELLGMPRTTLQSRMAALRDKGC